MITRQSTDAGGFRFISGEALPSFTSSANPFPNMPANCVAVLISVYSGEFNLRLDGAAATSASGAKFGVTPAPIVFALNYDSMKNAKAIGNAVGWVQYLRGA